MFEILQDVPQFFLLSLTLLPFKAILSFGERNNSHGATSGGWGGCERTVILFSQKFTQRQAGHGSTGHTFGSNITPV